MRLREKDREQIKATAAEVFGPRAVVRLFGSRVHDEARGGDIDLHVEIDPVDEDAGRLRSDFWSRLQDSLGEQKIDVIVSERGRPTRAIERIAYCDGVLL